MSVPRATITLAHLGILSATAFLTASAVQPDPSPAWQRVAPRAAPLIVGVGTHFGMSVDHSGYDPQRSIAALRSAGFASWRDNTSFGRWQASRTGNTTARAQMTALQRFATGVDATSPILNVTSWPAGPGAQNPKAYTQALIAAVPDYPSAPLIEIWNEWDKSSADRSVSGYSSLISTALPAIRAALPQRKVLVGAAADDGGALDFAWTRTLLNQPITRQASGISVHIYNHCAPRRVVRGAADMMQRLDGLHAAMVQQGNKLPVYVSEFGWPTGQGKCLVDENVAAANIADFTLLAASRPWIAGIWHYELKDSGQDPTDPESHFGVFDFNYKPKPGACAASFANTLVRNGTVTATYEANDLTAVLYRSAAGEVRTIAWATNATQPVTIKLSAATKVQPMCGSATTAGPGNYQVAFRPTAFAGDLLSAMRSGGGTSTLR